jgi:hypothetical protein
MIMRFEILAVLSNVVPVLMPVSAGPLIAVS